MDSIRLYLLAILMVSLISFRVKAQTVTNDGIPLRTMVGTTVVINGNFVNQTNGVAGSINNQGTIEVTADWTNNAGNVVFTTAAGIVIFDGTADQDIQGTNTTDFYGLEVNKATGNLITVTNTYDVRNALTLTDGIIMTTSATLLIVLDGATSTVGNASSYVDAPHQEGRGQSLHLSHRRRYHLGAYCHIHAGGHHRCLYR